MIPTRSLEWKLPSSHGIRRRKKRMPGRREVEDRGHDYLLWMVKEDSQNIWSLN